MNIPAKNIYIKQAARQAADPYSLPALLALVAEDARRADNPECADWGDEGDTADLSPWESRLLWAAMAAAGAVLLAGPARWAWGAMGL